MTEQVQMMKMRQGYGDALIELAKQNEKIVFISADCGAHERKWFYDNAKERLIETGIAEANSAAIAAGLASEGFKPYLLNFAYLLGRMYNQISQSIAEDAYPVSIAAYYGGVWGTGGRSHNCVTDLSMMRAFPNFHVYAPADYWETKTLIRKVNTLSGPSYVRLSGVPTPAVYSAEPEFSPVRTHQEGSDCTIFCHGTMVYESLKACKNRKLNCSVINISQIKPLPQDEIIREAKKTGAVVVAEEHSFIGGLAEAIALLLAEKYPVPVKKICVNDLFPMSVRMEESDVYGKYGISSDNIANAVDSVTKQK
jgi:transketolase